MKLEWRTREQPLVPIAVAAIGSASHALVASLLRKKDEELHALRGVHAEDLIVVLGESDALPWVDGAIYLGRDESAPTLLLPTTALPTLPGQLVERALLRHAKQSGPLAVIPERMLLVPIGDARPISRAQLRERAS